MPDFLKTTIFDGPSISPLDVGVRLLVAAMLGGVVAWIYRRTRKGKEISSSFPVTLVLLAILIAMVTQVIGDNVARAFSLVGALSIVRFRTVVRDTQDTAYVIFAVVVGMAIGAKNPWVGILGIGVIGVAAFFLRKRSMALPSPTDQQLPYALHVRMAIGQDADTLLGATMDQFVSGRRLV